jgi:alpha-glucosidase
VTGGGAVQPWWANAVVYQVYPRSFQDSNGDGVGDLRGLMARLDHLEWLGVDALWLSPIYPSPLADLGYDVADHMGVAPEYGTLADLDELVAQAHKRGLKVLLDLVPSHTSIEHPWFRLHPDWYVWSDDGPANNWLASFGGPAWSRDHRTGRWYLHSFYPEQPDLDWRNPAVRDAFGEVIRFWTARGVDGFRVDAIDRAMKDSQLRDDPPASVAFGLPLPEEYATLDHVHSVDDPEIGLALSALRHAAGGALLVGEVYLPTARLARYLEHLDLAFAFELLHGPFDAPRLRGVIAAASELGRVAWVLSNHDFPRLATRLGGERAALAAMLLLTLPGAAFIYQGDEIGMVDGPGADPPIDRAGRDPHRHPMQWASDPAGGFTTGRPWLPLTDPERRSVEAQRGAPGSMLELYRALIALRRDLRGAVELVPAEPNVLAFRRGEHLVALNLGFEPRPLPGAGATLVETAAGSVADGALAPLGGAVLAG